MTFRARAFAVGHLVATLAACGDDGAGPADDPDAGLDAAGEDAGREDAGFDAGPAIPWPRELPPSTDLGTLRGRRIARSIIHMHSPLSHDACDGEGWVDGALADPACLEHFRAAMCATRIDYMALTDHAPHVNEVDFAQALWIAEGDERVTDGAGALVAARLACPGDPHRVLMTVGSENSLMPINLRRHPGPDPTDLAALETLYDSDDPASVAAFRDAGALVWQAHTEGRPLDELRAIGVDGTEIYNLHANIDPRIQRDELGIDNGEDIARLLWFMERRRGLAPDLAFLAFAAPNHVSLEKWDTLLAEGVRIAGSGGTDAHENAFGSLMPDGERGDSYRRMVRWFTNHLLVDEVTLEGVEDALRRQRMYVAFEAYGTPVGFDFRGEDGATTREMGDEGAVGTRLVLARPRLPAGHPSTPAPEVSLHILRAAAGGAVEVASGGGETLEHVTTEAGAYRAEVRIVPHHAGPYLGREPDVFIRERTWVYSNAIFVR